MAQADPSEVFSDRGNQTRSEVTCHTVQSGILLLEEAGHIGRDLILVSEDEVIGVIQNFFVGRLRQADFAFDGDQHGGGAAAGGVEQQRNCFQAQNFAVQHRIARGWIGNDLVLGLGEKFVHGRGCETLLDTVTRGGILQSGNGDDVNLVREGVIVSGHVVAATGKRQCNERENAVVKYAGKKGSK